MDALFEARAESFISKDIHLASQNGFQFLTQFDQIQQAPSSVHLDQQIDDLTSVPVFKGADWSFDRDQVRH